MISAEFQELNEAASRQLLHRSELRPGDHRQDPVAGVRDHELPPPWSGLGGHDRLAARPLLEPAVGEHEVECDGAVDVRLVAERPGHVFADACPQIGECHPAVRDRQSPIDWAAVGKVGRRLPRTFRG